MFRCYELFIAPEEDGIMPHLKQKQKEFNSQRPRYKIEIASKGSKVFMMLGRAGLSLSRTSALPMAILKQVDPLSGKYKVCIRPSVFGIIGFVVVAAFCSAIMLLLIRQKDYSGAMGPGALLLVTCASTFYYSAAYLKEYKRFLATVKFSHS